MLFRTRATLVVIDRNRWSPCVGIGGRHRRNAQTNIILPRLGKEKLVSVSHADMDALHRYITSIRGTPIVANRAMAFLRRMFNLAKRWGWLAENPATGVRTNREEKRNRFLNRSEIGALVQALNDHSEPMSANAILLLMLRGARHWGRSY